MRIFAMVGAWVVEHTHHPLALLAAIVLVSGVLSAFFVNDTMCLVVKHLQLDRTGILSVWSAILSNLVRNVPAVLVFKPFITQLNHPQHAWLTLAMSSSLAGNLTVLGSMANLIVIERSRRTIKISFLEYLNVGVPLTLLTLWVGVLILGLP